MARLLTFVFRLLWHTVRFCFRTIGRILKTRLGWLCFLVIVLYFAYQRWASSELRVGTYNIRNLGPLTDRVRLTELLAETKADILALQEIQDTDVLDRVATELSASSSRHYRTLVSRCGGKRDLRLGFIYDADRVELHRSWELPELREDMVGRCSQGDRSGLLAEFSARRGFRHPHTYLLTVHFPAGGDWRQVQERQEFWYRSLGVIATLRAYGERRVLLLGDMNSTDYRDDRLGERSAIHRRVEQAGLRVLTTDLGCTEYWRPRASITYVPSHLDHIISTPDIRIVDEAVLHGYCPALRCQPTSQIPEDYSDVSDHCPVTVSFR